MAEPDLLSQLGDLAQKYHQAQATIAKLQQRIETQEYEFQEQAHRVQQLEERVAQAQVQLAEATHLGERLEFLKTELLQIVEERYGQARPAASETGSSLIKQQLDNHTQTLKELRRELDRMHRFDDQISVARTESTRLNQTIHQLKADLDTLGKDLNERVKPLGYVEEQRRIQAQSLTELQAELPNLQKKIDNALAKAQLLEQKIPQFAKYEAALDGMREEIRRHREHMDFQAAERERQLKNWTEMAETTEKRMRENEAMLEKYAEHYQLNKRALASLQDFQERLEREQHRLGELQRLAEERQRSNLEEFHADHERRWKKQTMELQPQLGDFQKSMATMQARMDELTKLNQTLETQVGMVLQIIEEDIEARAAALSEWQARFETLANGQG